MRIVMKFLMLSAMLVVAGCSTPQSGVRMKSVGYQARPALEQSLFKSDQDVLREEAIQRILTSKLELPEKAKLALMKSPGPDGAARKYYGAYYWRAEGYLKSQQEYVDTIVDRVSESDRLEEVVVLPSLLTPKEATVPLLREASVRLQADLLLVFRVSGDIYHKSMFLAKDKVKAYSTCEVVLLDVKTGIIPFTTIVTEETERRKKSEDLDVNETMRKAEKEAVLLSLSQASEQLVEFLNSAP